MFARITSKEKKKLVVIMGMGLRDHCKRLGYVIKVDRKWRSIKFFLTDTLKDWCRDLRVMTHSRGNDRFLQDVFAIFCSVISV